MPVVKDGSCKELDSCSSFVLLESRASIALTRGIGDDCRRKRLSLWHGLLKGLCRGLSILI